MSDSDDAAPTQEAARARGAPVDGVSLEEVARLCRIGPASTKGERAARNAAGGGPKARRAQHAAECLRALISGAYQPAFDEAVDIREQICSAVAASRFLSASTRLQLSRGEACESTAVEVRCCTVLAAAEALARSGDARVGVLNFASARNPGGGFTTGAEAQEESIARSSGLYPCLTKHYGDFFVPHQNASSGAYTHSLIHSPGVPVLRDEAGEFLAAPYAVDFVTAAAPNCGVLAQRLGWQAAVAESTAALEERIHRVLCTFANGGSRDLVLGAWGCGVFKNDPVIVAQLFDRALSSSFHGCFRRVLFAVLDPVMAEQFRRVFSGQPAIAAEASAPAAGKGTGKEQKGRWKGDALPGGVLPKPAESMPKDKGRKAKRWAKSGEVSDA